MSPTPKLGDTSGAPQSRRADLALVERKFFESRSKAQEAIAAGLVRVNGRALRKPSELVGPDARIEASAPYPWVSRGGVKLAAALDAFSFDPAGLACLDIGASTGGFTQVLLSRGAGGVVAVDVGREQLHPSLARDPRVVSFEATDARRLDPSALAQKPEFLTIDVSFISLALVLPAVLPLAAAAASLVALIKPQFEAGPGQTDKGIVKDEALRAAACARIEALIAASGWRVAGLIPSPIQGGDGNIEYLIGARRP